METKKFEGVTLYLISDHHRNDFHRDTKEWRTADKIRQEEFKDLSRALTSGARFIAFEGYHTDVGRDENGFGAPEDDEPSISSYEVFVQLTEAKVDHYWIKFIREAVDKVMLVLPQETQFLAIESKKLPNQYETSFESSQTELKEISRTRSEYYLQALRNYINNQTVQACHGVVLIAGSNHIKYIIEMLNES